jgi:hypothetical protein
VLLGDVRLGLGGLCSIAYLQVLKLQRKQRREKTSAMINGPIANGVREEWFLWPGVLLFLAAMFTHSIRFFAPPTSFEALAIFYFQSILLRFSFLLNQTNDLIVTDLAGNVKSSFPISVGFQDVRAISYQLLDKVDLTTCRT